jgi:hypothetical protein
MERCAGILGQCGPVAVEADKEGDESPDYFASLACSGGDWRYLIPGEQRPWATALRLSFNR